MKLKQLIREYSPDLFDQKSEGLNNVGIYIIYKKPWKGATESAIAFTGKTYNFKDIFAQITRQHRGGSKTESKKRFHWSSDFKFWYTQDSISANRAVKLISQMIR